jgi:preprotein translocase SecE subunit
MAPKKKNASRGSTRSQTTAARATSGEKEQTAKSAKGVTRDERQAQREEPRSKTTAKSSSAVTHDGHKQSVQPVRRESKQTSFVTRLRNSKVGRFIFDAYYELRHKVTWPSVEEVRNMTIAVIVLSLAIGLILGAVDFGLLKLFTLLSSRH